MTVQDRAKQFETEGYVVVRALFSKEETDSLRDHYMELRKEERWGDFPGVGADENDPLKMYPRMIHMHRWDEISFKWAIDKRLNDVMSSVGGAEPFMVQTMLYFKPAGARGQALHQDQYYLKAQPGTCLAAWMALDDCDEENGCLMVVPGSHNLPLLCIERADTQESFTDVTVTMPEGMDTVAIPMKAGDVLFFHGQLIHGSLKNRSTDRFRRSLIGHYITGDAQKVAQFYHPVYRMDGSEIVLGVSTGGGKCGVWVDQAGRPTIDLIDVPDGMFWKENE